MNHHACLMFLCIVLCLSVAGCGKGDAELQSENPRVSAADDVSGGANGNPTKYHTLTLSESSISVDDEKIKAGDGLEALASVLGQPDRKAGNEGDESWTWDGLGITANGSQAKIRSLYVKFSEFGEKPEHITRYPGVVIVKGRSPGQEAQVNAESDAEDLTDAQSIHHGFSATSDASSGNLGSILGSCFFPPNDCKNWMSPRSSRQNRQSKVTDK